MSRVLWKKALLPALDVAPSDLSMEPYEGSLPKMLPYPVATAGIPIPDPRAIRSMSRASVFLSHLCAQAAETLAPFLARSPYSVGIYCAVENGPIDAPSTARIIENAASAAPLAFPDAYRRFRNPKLYLKQLPNLAPAQMGITMGIRGPMNVYTHSEAGAVQALEQAEWDLRSGVVEAALVCAAHAFDDFLVLRRMRASEERPIAEGAAALVLAGGDATDWGARCRRDPELTFGIADPLVQAFRSL